MTSLCCRCSTIVSLNEAAIECFCDGNMKEAINNYESAATMAASMKPSCHVGTAKQSDRHHGLRFTIGEVDTDAQAPDAYFEGECDVGPRALRRPIHVTSLADVQAEIPLVKAVLAYNKALAHHSTFDLDEALEAYGAALEALSSCSPARTAVYASSLARLNMFIHNNVGHIRYREGEEEDALVHFRTALCWSQQLSNQETEDSLLTKATVLSNYARTQWMQGNVDDEINEVFQEVLRLRSAVLPEDHVDVTCAYLNLGFLAYARNEKKEAQSHLRRYLDAADKKGDNFFDPIPAVSYIILVDNEENDDALSMELVRAVRALQDKREDFGADHVEVASLLNYIGTILFHRRELKSAILFYRQELKLEERLTDEAPGISVSVTYNNIGRILQELGDLPEAISCYKLALKTGGASGLSPRDFADHLATKHPSDMESSDMESSDMESSDMESSDSSRSSVNLFSTIWYNLGLIYDRMGSKGEAIEAFQMSLGLRQTLLGHNHPDIACLWYNIGTLQMETQMLDKALSSLRESLRIRRLGNCPTDQGYQHVLVTLKKLFALQQKRGHIDEALITLSEMAKLQSQVFPSELELCVTLRQMSEMQHAKGDVQAALATAHRGFEAMLTSETLNNPDCINHMKGVEELVVTLVLMASLYHEACDSLEADDTLQKAQGFIEMMVKQFKHSLPPTVTSALEVIRFMRSSQCAASA